MTTAEAIDAITDAGRFEILATRSLRELDDDCRAVTHCGVNEAGKTIANPVDGFCRVPGSDPPRFVMSAFTVNARDGLLRKWLFNHATAQKAKTATPADDGDLIKAAREVAGLKCSHPGAKFIVYLCTNRRLDMDLMQPVYETASQLGVEVRFLDQSRLRDFLDTSPAGQWLRQEHLGIHADQVSEPLLRHLSGLSLERYANEVLLVPVNELVPTAQAERAAAAMRDPSAAVHMLVGASGVGKSVIGQDLLRRHIRDGASGLWVPGELVAEAASLAEAIERALRLHHNRLGSGAGQAAIRLATAERPMLLVIDDINRADQPPRLLQKVLGWSKPPGEGGKKANALVRVICPVWDVYWSPFRHLYESLGWVRVHSVGSMVRPEAVSCLRLALAEQAGHLSTEELDGIAERLGDDPILLGLFGQLIRNDPSANVNLIAEDVLGRFVAKWVAELAVRQGRPEQLYAFSLKRLARDMIRRKTLYPTLADLGVWLEDDRTSSDSIYQLAAQGHICRFSQRGGTDRLEFRHDRILEYQLTLAAADMVCSGDSDCASACDPFFTTNLGRAVARDSLPELVLNRLSSWNPNSLVAAVRFLPLGSSDYTDGVVAWVKAWLSQTSPVASRRWDALRTLADTCSPRVLDATEDAPEDMRLLHARLRNGDALAGCRAFAIQGAFTPASSYPWLEALIDQAKAHHLSRLVPALQNILTDNGQDDRARSAALCLAGYLGDPSLAEAVRDAWSKASDRDAILLSAIWAGLRCSSPSPAESLGPMLNAVLEMSDEEVHGGLSARASLLEQLGFAARHGLAESVLTYIVGLGQSDERHRKTVLALLQDIDHPIAVGYVAREFANAAHRAKQRGAFSLGSMLWGTGLRRRKREGRQPLSSASVAELRLIWEDSNSPDWMQDYAFDIWSSLARDLPALQAVPESSRHFRQAVWQRALRGDRSTVPHVLENLACDRRWLHVLASVWGQDVETALDAVISASAGAPATSTVMDPAPTAPTLRKKPWADAHHTLAHLLRDIPPDAAEQLFSRHWVWMSRIPPYVQAALYHGTPGTTALAKAALVSGDLLDDPFEHINHFFGFLTQGRMERLTERHLVTLLPYLDRLSDICLGSMVDFCRRSGFWGWAVQHLNPECRRRAQRAKPDLDGGPSYIVRTARHWFPTDEELLSDLDLLETEKRPEGRIWMWWARSLERGDPVARLPGLLNQWLRQKSTLGRLKVVAAALQGYGTRKDLAVIRTLNVEAEAGEVEATIADLEFAVMRRSLD